MSSLTREAPVELVSIPSAIPPRHVGVANISPAQYHAHEIYACSMLRMHFTGTRYDEVYRS